MAEQGAPAASNGDPGFLFTGPGRGVLTHFLHSAGDEGGSLPLPGPARFMFPRTSDAKIPNTQSRMKMMKLRCTLAMNPGIFPGVIWTVTRGK
jgi:hypothetical protein